MSSSRAAPHFADAVARGHLLDTETGEGLILPGGRSIVIERLPGADASGYAGLEDGVDYH